jgi:hypothetical protein
VNPDGRDTVEQSSSIVRTGRLWAVNASGYLSFYSSSQSSHPCSRHASEPG